MFTSFQKIVTNPVKFRLFLFLKLPAAFFSGVRVKTLTKERSETVVPYRWFTTNPFKSTYFACLSMAAEMSTGVLAMAHLYKRQPAMSILIIANEARYFKKATGKIIFSCEEGLSLKKAIDSAGERGEATEITVTSSGRNEFGEIVAVFTFTWSFKNKNNKV